MSGASNHMTTLIAELNWFRQVLDARVNTYFAKEAGPVSKAPNLAKNESPYAQLVKRLKLKIPERLVLMLAIAPHLAPHFLDSLFARNHDTGRVFAEFGGYEGKYHKGFLPTGETAMFLLTEGKADQRPKVQHLLEAEGVLFANEVIELETVASREPRLSRPLLINPRYLEELTAGNAFKPEDYALFPAKKVTTPLEWSDLVVDDFVMQELNLIRSWVENGTYLLKELELFKKVKPGYRALFYGPPGTGKTLAACLLGKSTQHDVYRIDLSTLVSKYIGETEKNLARIFDLAEKNRWILFFDEADAIFGKRTQTSSANDRFANQEVAYLLQRVEDFPGVVILASNLKSNMDEAFSRRFQSEVYFGMPEPSARLSLFKNIFSGKLAMETSLDLGDIARKYEISGGAMINVYRYAALKAISRQKQLITEADVLKGIRRELHKEGKTH